jgi:tRNA-dihydrouridine synthase B
MKICTEINTRTGRPPSLRIGRLEVSPPVLLAPMSALTNLPMRTLCEEAGCGLTMTEFVAAPALVSGVRSEVEKLSPSVGGRPFGAQIFGRDPDQIGRAAALAVSRGASLVDLNLGCPARKVT